MGSATVTEFSWRKHAVGEQWVAALKARRSRSPLADGEVLALLVPETLERLLGSAADAESGGGRREALPSCGCGINPFHAFYAAGECALSTVRAILRHCDGATEQEAAELAKLAEALRRQGAEEIDLFCQVCVRKHAEAGCRLAQTPAGASSGRHMAPSPRTAGGFGRPTWSEVAACRSVG